MIWPEWEIFCSFYMYPVGVSVTNDICQRYYDLRMIELQPVTTLYAPSTGNTEWACGSNYCPLLSRMATRVFELAL